MQSPYVLGKGGFFVKGTRILVRITAVAAFVLGAFAWTSSFSRAEAGPAVLSLLRVVRVGQGPIFLAVDQRTSRVFVANQHGNSASVLDARTGALVRTVPIGDRPGPIALDEKTGRVFMTNIGGTISVLDAQRGIVVRTIRFRGTPGDAVVAGHGEHVFVGNYNGDYVEMLDARTTRLQHMTRAGQDPGILAADNRTNRVFVATWTRSQVSVLDGSSGKLLRTLTVFPGFKQMAVDEPAGRVFLTSSDNVRQGRGFRLVSKLYVLDSRTGQILHVASLPSQTNYLTVDGSLGRLFMAMQNIREFNVGRLEVLDARTGGLIRSAVIPGGSIGSTLLDERAHHLFVFSNVVGADTLRVLNDRSLRVLRSLQLPSDPTNGAIDQQTHRLFITSDGGNNVTVFALAR